MSARVAIPAGSRFGRWVVLAAAEPRHGQGHALVRCDCGQLGCVATLKLRRGESRSCGAGGCRPAYRPRTAPNRRHAPVAAGARYGRWVVLATWIEREGRDTPARLAQTQCDCGVVRVLAAPSLACGKTTRCEGCRRAGKGVGR